MKLVENIPNILCSPGEKYLIQKQKEKIKERINKFLNAWLNIPENKKKLEKKKNKILNILLKKEVANFFSSSSGELYYYHLNIFENPLIDNYISLTRIIKDLTPFCFKKDELARQICLIDHEYFCKIKYQDFTNNITKQKISESFEIFYVRDLQLKCYILSLIYKQDFLDKKREIIKNFIHLAKILKKLNNYQTSFTIISVLSRIDITGIKDIWRSLEKYERDLFRALREEFLNIENNSGNYKIVNFINSGSNYNQVDNSNPMVPNINLLRNINDYFGNRIKLIKGDINEGMVIAKEYKFYIQDLENKKNARYSFHKVNPIYDFFDFGFIEIFRIVKIQKKINYDPKNRNFEQIYEDLVKIFLLNQKKF